MACFSARREWLRSSFSRCSNVDDLTITKLLYVGPGPTREVQMSSEGEMDASTSSLIGKTEAQAIIAALASDHNLDARLRTVSKTPSSKRSDVAVHAHYFPLRNGKPTMEEFVDRVLLKKLAKFCLPGREIRRAKERFATLTEDEIIEEGADLLNRAIDLFKKANKSTNRNGEFGEVIAYLLIESVLKAPQHLPDMKLRYGSTCA